MSETGGAADSPEPGVERVEPQPTPGTRWRDRAWTFRAMIAVAVASLLIGGIAGGVVVAATGGDDREHHQMGPWGPGMRVPPGWRGRGPRNFDDRGGPGWRWDDGTQDGPGMMPYGTPTPLSPSATPSSGATG